MEQGGKQGGNGGENPAPGKAAPGPGRDLANLPPHRGNKIKRQVAKELAADVKRGFGVVSYAIGGNWYIFMVMGAVLLTPQTSCVI